MRQAIVVGGGVMGCLSALELLQRGWQVTLLEAGETGREASWAAGGLVTPLYPWHYCTAISALANWSQRAYPQLAASLAEATGIDPELTACGLMWLDAEERDLALDWAQRNERDLQALEQPELYSRVAQLAPGFSGALWQADLANLRNPRMMQALRARLRQFAGFELQEHCPVSSLLVEQGRCVGVRSGPQTVTADAVVLAAGAWSAGLLQPLGVELPVEPVKGQMLLYKMPPGWLECMVMYDGRYAIPRRDGHIVVGSTLEYSGFDKTTDDQALATLKTAAERMLPALAGIEPVMQWAGLRPGSPDGVPWIGELPQVQGLWLNCGHFRNGLVLAPASCHLLAALMDGQPAELDAAPYNPATRGIGSAA